MMKMVLVMMMTAMTVIMTILTSEDIDGRCDELLRNIWRGGYRATSIIGVATSATWSHARAMTMMRMAMATNTLAMMRNEDGNGK